jgi:hypothetical protein
MSNAGRRGICRWRPRERRIGPENRAGSIFLGSRADDRAGAKDTENHAGSLFLGSLFLKIGDERTQSTQLSRPSFLGKDFVIVRDSYRLDTDGIQKQKLSGVFLVRRGNEPARHPPIRELLEVACSFNQQPSQKHFVLRQPQPED